MHDELVERLAPGSGVRWLDVGTGSGQVALRAARAGAEVTALDISSRRLDEARANAVAEGLTIALDLGDAQALPYGDAAFDVVSSCFGAIFAPDREAVARELARVCRPGGRLGLTAWRPKAALEAIYRRFQEGPPPVDHADWGREENLDAWLGPDFELELAERTWVLEGASPEAVYAFMADSAPPTAALLERLDADRREAFRAAFVEYWSRYDDGEGVREPRPYLLVLGRRRA